MSDLLILWTVENEVIHEQKINSCIVNLLLPAFNRVAFVAVINIQ